MILVEHANRELERAGLFGRNSAYDGLLGRAVLELITVFAQQGHSGGSAPMVASLFSKLANYGILEPLTGDITEWVDVGGGLFQNNRCSAVFMKDSVPTYVDAIAWVDDVGAYTSGGVDIETPEGVTRISSTQEITFPFTPKTFHVNVHERPEGGVYTLDVPEQLQAALDYYPKQRALN